MKAIKFKGANAAFTSPSGELVPAFKSTSINGTFVCGYRLSFWERICVLLFGNIWFSQITNNAAPKAFIITVNKLEVLKLSKKNKSANIG